MNILFICSANYQRSKTAEDYFNKEYGLHEFKSAGTNHKECKKRETTPLSNELMIWADKVFVMEKHHENVINEYSKGTYQNKINVLNIPDVYQYNQPELIDLLKRKVNI